MGDPRPSTAVKTRPEESWLRKYPPLIALVIAVLVTLVVLPSALNLPQANPSTVLEYAPVPPEDDSPPPPEGSISQLGLGSSSSLSTGTQEPVPSVSEKKGAGSKPITKRCVGNPPRQTEDPNSPPCVPFYEGDNGGATWQGVTRDEIIVLVYADRYIQAGDEGSPPVGYCDVDKPANTESSCAARDGGQAVQEETPRHDWAQVEIVRAYSKYFNERFQTYNRHVHFWMYFTSAGSPAARRADAHANWERLKPFAAIQVPAFGGYDDVYTAAIVARKAMSFGALLPRANSYFRQYQPYVWNYWPDVEHWADQYVSYVCQTIAGKPVTFAGPGIQKGSPRKYAFMYTTDKEYPALTYFSNLVESGIKNCPDGPSITISERAPFPRHQYAVDTHSTGVTAARDNVAKMEAAGITTVIWAGGYETQHTTAARDREWYPEWVVAGDQWQDYIGNARFQQQDVWRYAILVSNLLREDVQEKAPCRQAYTEADPQGDEEDQTCDLYASFFELFKAIQTAGPYIAPDTVDQGLHAIQRKASPGPYIAACFYDPGDYTCVKDAREAWWDPDAADPDGDPDERGCWRMPDEGKRYLAWEWPGDPNKVFANRNDPCDNQGNSVQIHPYGDAQE